MFNIILAAFYFVFPIMYQALNAFAYWITLRVFSTTKVDSTRYLILLNTASAVFYIALFLVISLFKGSTVSAGLFPTVSSGSGLIWTNMIRGTVWFYAINILSHTMLIKMKTKYAFTHLLWLVFLCNTITYLLTLILSASLS